MKTTSLHFDPNYRCSMLRIY
jgi:hypothetical protein